MRSAALFFGATAVAMFFSGIGLFVAALWVEEGIADRVFLSGLFLAMFSVIPLLVATELGGSE